MQKALALTPCALAGLKRLPEGFRVVYLGSEVCRHLLPAPAEFRRALALGADGLVLAAPILSDAGIKKFSSLVNLALKLAPGTAASVNDIGTLSFLSREYGPALRLSMGRQLSSVFLKMTRPFLNELRGRFAIEFFETDDAAAAAAAAGTGLPVAFHAPFRLFSVTRICPYHGAVPAACGRLCADRPLPLDGGKLLLKGCSYLSPCKARPSVPPQRLIITPGG